MSLIRQAVQAVLHALSFAPVGPHPSSFLALRWGHPLYHRHLAQGQSKERPATSRQIRRQIDAPRKRARGQTFSQDVLSKPSLPCLLRARKARGQESA